MKRPALQSLIEGPLV